jgi:hypothetical protein
MFSVLLGVPVPGRAGNGVVDVSPGDRTAGDVAQPEASLRSSAAASAGAHARSNARGTCRSRFDLLASGRRRLPPDHRHAAESDEYWSHGSVVRPGGRECPGTRRSRPTGSASGGDETTGSPSPPRDHRAFPRAEWVSVRALRTCRPPGASQRRLRDGTYDRFSERWAWICASTVFRAPLLSTLCAVELPVVVHGGDALARFRGGHVEQLGGLQSCFAACVSATGRLAAHAGVLPLGEEAPKSSCAVADESAGVAPSMSLGGWRVLRDVTPLGWPPSGR